MWKHYGLEKSRKKSGQAFNGREKPKNGKETRRREDVGVKGKIVPFYTKGKNMESVFHVAAYILSKESMNHKKLQKLCFYAQSWNYAFTDELLFDEPFEAWVHGPVCPILYKAYKQWGSLNIPMFKNLSVLKLSKRSREIIDSVYEAYGKFSADILEACTHQEYPWKNARRGYEPGEYCRNVISNEEMKQVCLDKLHKLHQG